MTINDVRITFNFAIKGDALVLPDESVVDVEFFANLFKDAPANPTFADLMAVDAGVLGYAEHFNIWKDKGFLMSLSD
jgi:hypothetical protein